MDESYIYRFFHLNSRNYNSQVKNAPGKNYEIDVIGKQYPTHPLSYNELSKNMGTITSSCREYEKEEIEIKLLSKILKSSYFLEVTNTSKINSLTPSAGGLYPIEIYIITSPMHSNNGTYHYNKTIGTLSYIRDAINFNSFLTPVNKFLNDVSFLVIMTAKMENIVNKYGARGYRYVLIEAGHIGQNISRAIAQNPDLGCCAIGGFYDNELHQQLNLPDDEIPIYIYGIGKKDTSIYVE